VRAIEDIRRVLVETATGANKQVWATVTCKHCERQGRYEVVLPDYRVRLDAVEALQAHVVAEFAGELEALRDGNIEALLRERLASLGEDERRVLREALADELST
jgi:hypothetical protein